MIIQGKDSATGGPLDIWCILHNVKKGTFHPAFFEEAPFPGPVPGVEKVKTGRLKSKMHHTTGFRSLEEAQRDLRDNALTSLVVDQRNFSEHPILWDGNIPLIWLTPNWRDREGKSFDDLVPRYDVEAAQKEAEESEEFWKGDPSWRPLDLE